ncbi:RNA polymerase I-specific transcription initiation factor RRN3-like [Triticum dicoccoides]|uniref:RNA polymerase I-specific transcription initiation factor RRN3-like n=1 Tax=Triticum dicoccoides TaxID=85692 RepID=UPI00188EAD92|nr:RNA polymerase I-specific transcription initiation factor RRN3-like [Triticum dicoccoides]
MVAKLRRDDMSEEANPICDSVAFGIVGQVLQSVRMEPHLADSHALEQYHRIVGILDTSKRRNPDKENPDKKALYVTCLKALASEISKIDINYHHSLLKNIFTVSIWYLPNDTIPEFLELITRLAAVADDYLTECLHLLVNNFVPPLVDRTKMVKWAVSRKTYIFSQLCMCLIRISNIIPLAPKVLRGIIDKCMPNLFDSKDKTISFVECMLGLDTGRMGDLIRAVLLDKIVHLLTELDVNITWEGILQEQHNKGIFDMELQDLDGNEEEDGLGHGGVKVLLGANAHAEKLDDLMVVIFEHFKSLDAQCLHKEFTILKTIFRASVLTVDTPKFVQFIMFYICARDPEICALEFALFLTDIFKNKEEDPISRMSAVSYIGSYLSRARFISDDTVVAIIGKLVDWLVDYCDHESTRESTCGTCIFPCFRLRYIMDCPNLKSDLFRMPFGTLFHHQLEPLKVCLPSIVSEFLRQAKGAKLVAKFVDPAAKDTVESDCSRTSGGINRFDMFFPFDPYLLKESDRYISSHFEVWSMVMTESDDSDDVLDTPEMNADGGGSFSMPARIKPSASPPMSGDPP